jgi:hypothetical protein
MINQILEKVGLKYEDLNAVERETLSEWSEVLSKGSLSVDNVKTHIKSMRESVEKDLTVSDLNSKQDLLLKARLRNYMLLEAYLSTPEKAKQAIDRAIAGIVSGRK